MEYGYVVKLSNRNLYKEVQLPTNAERLKIGMDIDCDVRLYKDDFFEKFELFLLKTKENWQIICSENVYIDVGDVRKLMTMELRHGDTFRIKYQSSDHELFQVDFLFDFDNEQKNYDRVIDIRGQNTIVIGSAADSSIVLESQYTARDFVVLKRGNGSWILCDQRTNYGVYHNGVKAVNGEKIQNGDFISIADVSFYIKNDMLYTEASDKIYANALPTFVQSYGAEYPKFNRNIRIKQVIDDEKIEILDPPAKPQEPKNNLFTRLLPSLGMLVMAGVMAFMGGAMVIISAISGVMSIITAIIGVRESKKDFKKKSAERIEKYNHYIEHKKNEIEICRENERISLEDIYISQECECERFISFSSDLFDRQPDDEDYLVVRFGTGDVEAKREISYKKQERLEVEDELQELPEKLSNAYYYVHEAPIVCDFKCINAIGIVGDEASRFGMFKNIVIDLCARHYQTDVKMFFIAEAHHREQVYWLRMLPHVYNDVLGIRNIVCNDESKNLVFDYLYKELSSREQSKHFDYNIIIFFYDEYGFKRHPISKFVGSAKELGVTFVFFREDKSDVPQGCDFLVELNGDNSGLLIHVEDRNKTNLFTYSAIPNEVAEQIVELLSPVYTEEISLESTLTKNITLFELLNVLAVDDLNLESRWAQSQVFKSMSAPIGISKSSVVSLDLHDKAHGPHGLVAGTTGSGKSEILQTYVLSMATLFHPYEVAFVIIDFKGGGMVNQFKDLPHLLGAITNIDGKEIERSLKSIKAELQKRQRLFADADVNHIDKYIKKYKAGEVKTPLPHLIVIVDEFAELKAEQPEFMKELISAARIGRSLGVHLILATQKPSGQVNEQIWSNSRFKLCLKVQSQEDSNEVLKSPLAAEIKEPGRAYLQVGNNEIFELFQSAYSGAPEKAADSNIKNFSIYNMTDSGRRVPIYVQKKKSAEEGNRTQLDALVDYISHYCKTKHIQKIPDICLPSLPHLLRYERIDDRKMDAGAIVSIGYYDDPANQYQGEVFVNLSEDNLLVIGSAQYGKTNVLQTIIRDLAEHYSSNQVNVYVIDFGSMVLKNLEGLNHVGGVVISTDEERLINLFKMLTGEVSKRKERLATEGVSSFRAYLEAGFMDLPQIVLMIDNMTALQQLYPNESEELLTLCREGTTVGLSIVIVNNQTNGIGYKYLANFAQRIALFCNDSGEYSSLFDRTRIVPDNMPGRALVEISHQIMEAQIFLAFEGEREIDRVNTMRSYVADVNQRSVGDKARAIPVVPDVITMKLLKASNPEILDVKYRIPYGMNFADMRIEYLNLLQNGILGITGREESGKTNFLRNVINTIQSNIFTDLSSVYIFDDMRKKLEGVAEYGCVQNYTTDASDAKSMIEDIYTELQDRKSRVSSGETSLAEIMDSEPLLILVVSGQDAVSEILQDSKIQEKVMTIVKELRRYKAFVILSGFENVSIPYSAPAILKHIKESKDLVVFDDIANVKFIDIPLKYQKEYAKEISVGDAFVFIGGKVNKVKTILDK